MRPEPGIPDDAALDRADARRGRGHLVCEPGCTECCIGPFAVNALDARRLRRGLRRFSDEDPERPRALVERARQAETLIAFAVAEVPI